MSQESGILPADQTIVEPKTDEIAIKGRLLGDFAAMETRLSSLQLFISKMTADGLTLAMIESRDIQKRPYLFVLMELGDFAMERRMLKGIKRRAESAEHSR